MLQMKCLIYDYLGKICYIKVFKFLIGFSNERISCRYDIHIKVKEIIETWVGKKEKEKHDIKKKKHDFIDHKRDKIKQNVKI